MKKRKISLTPLLLMLVVIFVFGCGPGFEADLGSSYDRYPASKSTPESKPEPMPEPMPEYDYEVSKNSSEGSSTIIMYASKSTYYTVHTWQYLTDFGGELEGYGVYTYVLSGRGGSNSISEQRYLSLINAITSSTTESKSLRPMIDIKTANMFVIPASKKTYISDYKEDEEDGSQPTCELKPDYELSKAILSVVGAYSQIDVSKPGPYLITFVDSIAKLEKRSFHDILFVDLTYFDSEAMSEVVKAYKQEISSEEIAGINELESFRLSLLNALLWLDESISFAKVAHADLIELFE